MLYRAIQTRRSRTIAATAIAAVVMPIVCAAAFATHGTPGRSNAWTRPHVLTIADGGDVATLNPHLAQSAPVANLSEMTMAWLVKWDERNRPYPELATEVPTKANGGVSRDGRTIIYHVRRGVTWSDGAPFDADDVVFSTAVVNNPANDEAARMDEIEKVDEPDKFTVVYHLKKPYSLASAAFFSSCCANPCLLPKHVLAKYPNINHVPYNDLPIGIGPFVFERWDRRRRVVLTASPRYWRGRPKLDKIVYEIVPDRDTLLAQLRTHDVDLWYQFGGAYLARIQQLPGYRVLRQPSYAYDHIDFNLSHRTLADANVRRALRLAVDRRADRRSDRARRRHRSRFGLAARRAVFHGRRSRTVRPHSSERAPRSERMDARCRRHPREERRAARVGLRLLPRSAATWMPSSGSFAPTGSGSVSV